MTPRRLKRMRTKRERDRIIARQMELWSRAQMAREPSRGLIIKRVGRLQKLREEAEELAGLGWRSWKV